MKTDVSMHNDNELVTIVDNDEYLYNLIRFDRRQALEVIEEYYIFNDSQWDQLEEYEGD